MLVDEKMQEKLRFESEIEECDFRWSPPVAGTARPVSAMPKKRDNDEERLARIQHIMRAYEELRHLTTHRNRPKAHLKRSITPSAKRKQR
jgi:hypothetical protein